MGSVTRFLLQKLAFLFAALFSVSCYFPLFRLKRNGCSLGDNSGSSGLVSKSSRVKKLIPVADESETVLQENKTAVEFPSSDDESTDFTFSFRFPTFEEFCKSNEDFPSCDFTPAESFGEESEDLGLGNSQEKTSYESKETAVGEFLSDHDFLSDAEDVLCREEVKENLDGDVCAEQVVITREENVRTDTMAEADVVEENVRTDTLAEADVVEENVRTDTMTEADVDESCSDDTVCASSDSGSIGIEHMRSVMNGLMDPYSDFFLSDEDFELDDLKGIYETSGVEEKSENEDIDDENSNMLEELEELEEGHSHNVEKLELGFLSENDFDEKSGGEEDDKPMDGSGMPLDSGDTNKLETLWEHQELIDQLKMELRKVRATGLPTIFEDSESPKMMEDLKPWKIDESFRREDRMGELHKFFKSYSERMRKFDILNYQKMYALGLLQLKDPKKDPLQSISGQKSSGPTLKSLLSQNLWVFKQRTHDCSDPMTKFIKELHSDLEVVYVGQMCLSWEFLHWQYEKALDLWDTDPSGIRSYNEVADEFQQFQVLLQRFIEDEPFKGPRVQNYVKSRCLLRNLLQVPVIREDRLKGKMKTRKRERGDYTITSDVLVEIIEESIRIFWRFVRADKGCSSVTAKAQKVKHPDLQNPQDSELLDAETRSLHKKERKLRELLRSENCILRRFRRCREDDDSEDHVLYFFSQVDMKLVSRVLNMSRITTDQLVWCRDKLSKISFENRKILVEPSLLLFPC